MFRVQRLLYFGRAKAKKPPSAIPTQTQASSPISESVRSSAQHMTDSFLNAVVSEKAKREAVVAAATLEYKCQRFSEDLALKECLFQNIGAFKKQGPWAEMLLELYAQIRLIETRLPRALVRSALKRLSHNLMSKK